MNIAVCILFASGGENVNAAGLYSRNEAEKVHEKLFLKAAEAVEKSSDIAAESFHLCPVCGYVSENEAPEKCPICGAPSSSFKKY